jgi:hypothetical protein
MSHNSLGNQSCLLVTFGPFATLDINATPEKPNEQPSRVPPHLSPIPDSLMRMTVFQLLRSYSQLPVFTHIQDVSKNALQL